MAKSKKAEKDLRRKLDKKVIEAAEDWYDSFPDLDRRDQFIDQLASAIEERKDMFK